MERTKRIRSQFRVQFIPLEEMFTSQELMDLRAAFDAVSMGQDFVDRASLQSSFQNLGIIASEEMLAELLNAMGQIANQEEEDLITFEVFARCVALLLEENAEKVSTSSHQNEEYGEIDPNQEAMYQQMYGQEQDPYGQEEQYYNDF